VSTPQFLLLLQGTALAGCVRGETSGCEWIYPIVETFHVLSLATVYGSIAMVDLRLLGISSRDSTVSRLSSEVLPWTWIAFVCAAVTGSLMFISKAETFYGNFATRLKFMAIALAGLNMRIFHFGVYRRVNQWDNLFPTPPSARLAGFLSLLMWTTVIASGRWIGWDS
jgi:hypothetical protein